jgi:hypothetical protein
MWEALPGLLYYLGVGAAWEPIRRARRTKKGEFAQTSAFLGITALLLSVALGFLAFYVVVPLFRMEPRGGGVAAFAILICLFCFPFVAAWLVSAGAGLVTGLIALCDIRRNGVALALIATFLNLLVLALPLILVRLL